MNKFLSGCLIAVAVIVIGGASVFYFAVIRPAASVMKEVVQIASEMESLNEQIVNTDSFDPGDEPRVSDAQIDRLLAVHRSIREQLSGRLDTLESRLKEIEARSDENEAELSDLAGIYGDIGSLLLDVKRAQVQALNDQDFSLEEYEWVRMQVFLALGQQRPSFTLGKTGFKIDVGDEVDESLAERLEPYRDELMKHHSLAWFGM